MSQPQVEPRLKDNLGRCGCGLEKCGKEGVLRAKPWRDGVRCVKHGCPCRRCLGGRSKRQGGRAQRKAAQALGVPRVGSLRPGHEEHYAGAVRLEVKSGAQALPVWTRYLAAEAQSNAARSVGDNRPFVACFEPKDTTDGLIVFRRSALAETVAAIAEQLGMVP